MAEPCRSCERRFVDFGGCRCQAMALAGRAELTDPACSLSPLHDELVGTALREAATEPPPFVYRRPGGAGRSAARTEAAPEETTAVP